MRPASRISAGDFVKVDCAAYSHMALLASAFLDRLSLSPPNKVLDLKDACDAVVAVHVVVPSPCHGNGVG